MIFKILVLQLFIFTLIQCNPSGQKETIELPLPDFNVQYVNSDQSFTREKMLQDKNVYFVHFWATWCGPCEKELPDFIKFARSFEIKKAKFILWAVDDKKVEINKFLKKLSPLPTNILVVMDSKKKESFGFGTSRLPETYVFNAQGVGKHKFIGAQDWMSTYYKTYLQKFLAKYFKQE